MWLIMCAKRLARATPFFICKLIIMCAEAGRHTSIGTHTRNPVSIHTALQWWARRIRIVSAFTNHDWFLSVSMVIIHSIINIHFINQRRQLCWAQSKGIRYFEKWSGNGMWDSKRITIDSQTSNAAKIPTIWNVFWCRARIIPHHRHVFG